MSDTGWHIPGELDAKDLESIMAPDPATREVDTARDSGDREVSPGGEGAAGCGSTA